MTTKHISGIDLTKTQLAVFFSLLLLAVDEINPIKILIHVFPAIAPWHVASVCIATIAYVCVSQMKDLIYFSVKTFFHSIVSIFFRDVEIIGRQNIPRQGPVLFSINHANQFMDAAMVLCTCQQHVSYLMAEASYKRRVIGDLAWAMGVVPVKRAQDYAKVGTGKITMTVTGGDGAAEIQVAGTDTAFTKELSKGDKIRPAGNAIAFKVASIENDTSLIVELGDAPADCAYPKDAPVAFDVMQHTDTKLVFAKVIDRLADGGAVGIFPEGGSHDRTDLLPLKVGVALIAYSALEENGINVPIVPVGLNYFRAHRWRGRAVVEYGQPINIDPSTLGAFKAGGGQKREVCNKLLENIESSMRSVIVAAPDYETLEIIHTARRLYMRNRLASGEKQDLSRRFAEGYRKLLLMTDGNPPQEWLDLQDRIVVYKNELKFLGIKDYQVPSLQGKRLLEDMDENVDGDKILGLIQLVYQILHLLFLLLFSAVPFVLLNLPVGILAGLYAERRRKRALAKSKVKVRGFDVMLTEKVVFCIVMVPILWLTYGALLYCFSSLDGPAIALAIFSMPLFAYLGVVVAEAGMIDWKELRVYLMRVFPSTRRRMAALPQTQRTLQKDLREFIKAIGPGLGEIYYGKDVDWATIRQKSQLEKKVD